MTHNILLTAIALTIFPGPAFAYIDPGSGSMLLQLLIAAVIGGWVAFKLWWSRIKTFIFESKMPVSSSEESSTSEK